ncbi:hypothetical protein BV25DRAFT_1830452 [Artomyces pyxidatus]|uniref:Uncharacterized protein n=1 Tax=Artomyces pyxidatus TaxID=48021 RepID=A0ACB8SPF6_9AGAM|nr:hypothetical protein BV25DRAFT_1830452 [Artomyces pyxidatus]
MPIATRSKTGNFPTPSLAVSADEDDVAEDPSASGDDFKMSSEEPETRPVKRAKLSSPRKEDKRPGPSRRRKGRLSELPSMPLDILFEIFGHLSPSDLVALSRVNKAFRQVLISRQSAYLWRESYSQVPDVPTCPDDMNELSWALLLFGGNYCYTCGTKPVPKILFELRRRACKSCMEAHLRADTHAITSEIPNFSADLLELVPYAENINFKRRQYYWRCWWDADIWKLKTEIDAIREMHSHDSADICAQALAKFKAERKVVVDARKVHARRCAQWENERLSDRSNELSDIRKSRFDDIQSRFLELGFHASDVIAIRRHKEVSVARPMSDRVWTRIFPILKPEVEKHKATRLAREIQLRKRDRDELVRERYRLYSTTQPPLLVPYLPPASVVAQYEAIKAAIHDDTEASEELGETLTFIILSLVPQIRSSIQKRIDVLLALIPGSNPPTPDSEDADFFRKDYWTGVAGGLGLVTSVFSCPPIACYRRLHFGFEALAHRCNTMQELPAVVFNEAGSAFARELLEELKMDPTSTTALDLDRLDARFICMECPVTISYTLDSQTKCRQARTWRASLTHALDNHANSAVYPGRWKLLSSEEVKTLPDNNHYFDRGWGCCHCVLHLEHRRDPYSASSWFTRGAIREHLRTDHRIEEPLEGDDFFYDTRNPRQVSATPIPVEVPSPPSVDPGPSSAQTVAESIPEEGATGVSVASSEPSNAASGVQAQGLVMDETAAVDEAGPAGFCASAVGEGASEEGVSTAGTDTAGM